MIDARDTLQGKKLLELGLVRQELVQQAYVSPYRSQTHDLVSILSSGGVLSAAHAQEIRQLTQTLSVPTHQAPPATATAPVPHPPTTTVDDSLYLPIIPHHQINSPADLKDHFTKTLPQNETALDSHMTFRPQVSTANSDTLIQKALRVLRSQTTTGHLKTDPSLNHFELRDPLGQGGVGIVFKARQNNLQRDVAVKKLLSNAAQDRAKEAFLAEALVTANLDHPNIVPIHDLRLNERGEIELAMKIIRGHSWDALLHPKTPKQKARAKDCDTNFHVNTLMSVINALAFAHSKNVAHCDLKPENVMIGDYGEVYLLDWGIAVCYSENPDDNDAGARPRMTIENPCGTPLYMAPELAEGNGRAIGSWTDIFLCGAILHELLTGSPPHSGNSFIEVLVSATEPKELQFGAKAPIELQQICRKAMAFDPKARYRDIRSFQKDLQGYLEHRESAVITGKAQGILKRSNQLKSDKGQAALNEKERNALYRDYADAAAGFSQARELWKENPHAKRGEYEACFAYAEAALENGDLGLADAQAGRLNKKHEKSAKLIKAIESARRKKLRGEALTRNLRLVVFGSACLVVTGLIVGLLVVNNSRSTALARQKDAEEARTVAESLQKKSETAEKNERDQRKKAEKAQSLAETAQKKAEAAREAEKEARQRAQKALRDLQTEKQRSLAAREAEKLERNRAEIAVERADKAEAQAKVARKNAESEKKKAEAAKAEAQEQKERVAALEKPGPSSQAALNELKTLGYNSLKARPILAEHAFIQAYVGLKEPALLAAYQQAQTQSETLQQRVFKTLGVAPNLFATDALLTTLYFFDKEQKQLRSLSLKSSNDPAITVHSFEDQATCITASPIGKYLFIGHQNKKITVWSIDKNKKIGTLSGHRAIPRLLVPSPNGKLLLSVDSKQQVKLWDLRRRAARRLAFTNNPQKNKLCSFHFSANSQLVALCFEDGRCQLWTLTTNKILATLPGSSAVVAAKFTQDGRRFICATKSSIQAWDVNLAKRLFQLNGHTDSITGLFLGKDSERLISSSKDKTLRFWDLREQKELFHWSLDSPLLQLFSSPNSPRWLVIDAQNTPRLFQKEEPPSRHKFLRGPISSASRKLAFLNSRFVMTNPRIQFNDTATLFVKHRKGTAVLWNNQKFPPISHLLKGHEKDILDVAFSPDGKSLATASKDRTVLNWNIDDGTLIKRYNSQNGSVHSLQFSLDSRTLYAGCDNGTVLYLVDGVPLVTLVGHKGAVLCLDLSPDGKNLSAGDQSGQISIWDTNKIRKPETTLKGHKSSVTVLQYDEIGAYLASGDKRGVVKIWDLKTSREVASYQAKSAVCSIRFSADQTRLISGHIDGSQSFFNRSANALYKPSRFPLSLSQTQRFDSSARFMVSIIKNRAILWDLLKLDPSKIWKGHKDPIQTFALTPAKPLVATGDTRGQIILWKFNSKKAFFKLKSRDAAVSSLEFSQDGALLMSGHVDGTIELWDAKRGKSLGTAKTEGESIVALSLSADKKILATASANHSLKIWTVNPLKEVAILVPHKQNIVDLQFSNSGRWLLSRDQSNNTLSHDIKSLMAKLKKSPEKLLEESQSRTNLMLVGKELKPKSP